MSGWDLGNNGWDKAKRIENSDHLRRILAPLYKPQAEVHRAWAGRDPPFAMMRKIDNKHMRVLSADYEMLRRDFAHLQDKSEAEIDVWLLDEAGYVRQSQLDAGFVRGVMDCLDHHCSEGVDQVLAACAVDGDDNVAPCRRSAYVPHGYGRAVVMDVLRDGGDGDSKGVLDVKGGGTAHPFGGLHNDGMLSLERAMLEFWRSKVVDAALTHARANSNMLDVMSNAESVPWGTVGCYAVLSLPFAVAKTSALATATSAMSSDSAALLVRQGHARLPGGVIPSLETMRLQRALQPYGILGGYDLLGVLFPTDDGIASSAENKTVILDWQASTAGQLVDFNTVRFLTADADADLVQVPYIDSSFIMLCYDLKTDMPRVSSERCHAIVDSLVAGAVALGPHAISYPIFQVPDPTLAFASLAGMPSAAPLLDAYRVFLPLDSQLNLVPPYRHVPHLLRAITSELVQSLHRFYRA